MRKPIEVGAFTPKLSQTEVRRAATTRVAREIADKERAQRDAKAARLRAARQASEAEDSPASVRVPTKKPAARKQPVK